MCGGYTRQTRFVLSEDVRLETTDQTSDENTIIQQGRWRATKKGPTQSTVGLATHAAKPRLTWKPDVSSTAYKPPLKPVFACPSHMPSLWQQFHHIFLSTFLPRDNKSSLMHSKDDVTGNWLLQLQGEAILSPALQLSVAAYAASQVGRENNDEDLVNKSREMYLRSLKHLRGALAKRSSRLSDETLAACMALSVYELTQSSLGMSKDRDNSGTNEFFRTGNWFSAYNTHLNGAMMLTELRGPGANTSPLAHSLFLGLRRHMLLGSLMNHRDTFLSQPKWRERPWEVFPKNVLDECLDCMFDMPAVLRKWDSVRGETNSEKNFMICTDIVEACIKLDSRLHEWYGRYSSSIPGPLFRSTFSKMGSCTDDEKLGQVFPVSFQFHSFTVGYLLSTFWSGVMVVHHLLMQVHFRLAQDTRYATSVGAAEKHKDIWLAMITNLCQSTEYFLGDDMGRLGPTVALAGLKGCLACMAGGPLAWKREKIWILEQMGRIDGRLNFSSRDVLWE